MNLRIRPFTNHIKKLYEDHNHFHQGDAGLDLYIIADQKISPGATERIHLGIACETIESKPYMLMARSSISKTPLRLANSVGLIDAGYRGEIIAVVDNIKSDAYKVERGQRLFQLVGMAGEEIHFELVTSLSNSSRGSGGFGSTGK